MKVLLVNKFHYKKGGSETYYFTMAEALKARGHQVVYFSMKDEEHNVPCGQSEFFVSHAAVKGSITDRVRMVLHIAYSKEAYTNMKKLLQAEKPDLVILNLIHKHLTLSIIDAIKEYNPKLPIFWTMHDLITVCPSYTMLDGEGRICEKCLKGSFRPCVSNRCIKGSRMMSLLSKYEADYIRHKKWYDQVDLFICPSEFYYKKLKEAGFTKSKIVMMRNPLLFDAKSEPEASDEGYVLYFGRLSREKGIKTLIEAAGKVNCRLVIVGTGPMEEELKAYVKKQNFENIVFKGFQSGKALAGFIQGSRCVVLPSEWYENGPYSAMEAMAMGKPLIVSDNGGLPELVENEKNGYVYSTKNNSATALQECIEKMMDMPMDQYEKMVRCSWEKGRSMFDPDRYIDEIEKYYEELKGEK